MDSDLSLVRISSDFHHMMPPLALFFQEYRQRGAMVGWCNSMNLKVRKLLYWILPDQPTNPKDLFLWRVPSLKARGSRCCFKQNASIRSVGRNITYSSTRSKGLGPEMVEVFLWTCSHIASCHFHVVPMPASRRHILFIGHTTLGLSSESTWIFGYACM